MKKFVHMSLYILIAFTTVLSGLSYATPIATQDLFIIDKLKINSGGALLDLAPTIVSTALGSPGR